MASKLHHVFQADKSFYIELPLCEKKPNLNDVPIKFEDIFEPSKKHEKAPTRILVLGKSGCGKSTLANKICDRVGLSKKSLASKYEMVILFKLKELGKTDMLQEVLLQRLKDDYQEQKGKNLKLETVVYNLKEKLLVVLDGYDQLHPDTRASVKYLISKGSIFHSSTIVVTSRPEDLALEFTNCFERQLVIPELSKEVRKQFVQTFFGRDVRKAEEVKLFLRNHKLAFVAELSVLLLNAVCLLFQEQRFSLVQRDLGLIYEVLRALIIRVKETEIEGKELSEKKIQSCAYRLGKLFVAKLKNSEVFLKKKELKTVIGSMGAVVLQCGLFQMSWQESEEGWEIVEKCFMDCLAVYYLNEKLEKMSTVQQVAKLVRKNIGHLEGVKTTIFKKGLGVLVFNGVPKEIVYVCFGGSSIFHGQFETMSNVKLAYGSYVCLFKQPAVPHLTIFGENNGVLTLQETFENYLKNETKQSSFRFLPTRVCEGDYFLQKTTSTSTNFKLVGYIRMVYSLDSTTWASKIYDHPQCDESCMNSNHLPELMFKEGSIGLSQPKSKNWNLIIHDKSHCFIITK